MKYLLKRTSPSGWPGPQQERLVYIHRPFQARLYVLAATILFLGLGISQGAPGNDSGSSEVIQFLNQTVDWYRQLDIERQMATDPNDVLIVNDDRRVADQIVRLAFDFSRAKAQAAAKETGSSTAESQSTESSRYQALLKWSTKLDKQVHDTQLELESLRQKLETATGRKREAIQSAIAETRSELELVAARRDALHSMTDFVSGTSTSGLGATGLRAQIESLARSLPAALTEPLTGKEGAPSSSNESFNPALAVGANKPTPSGIWGLSVDVISLYRKIRALGQIINSTDALTQTSKGLRAPLTARLKELSQRGDLLANQPESEDPAFLAQQKGDLDALTAQFKGISAASLPLSKQGILLGLYQRSLTRWQGSVKSQYAAELRNLLLRLAFLAVVLAAVIGAAELWRKTIYRYIPDARRRHQFLLLRRIVLWSLIAIIIAFAFASELGSVATFAGLLTAGVAVALQNVILSVVGYFFLIGKYGIRIGDRVQVAGVTGEVIDIGLVRLHLMELGISGPKTPSGRVVAFSNSIVFQSTTGLFKQIPGTNFVWHEISLTLSPDSDYTAVEERLLGVVEGVFNDYREAMEQQRRHLERIFRTTPEDALQPKSRLRLTPAGLEAAIRFPVDLQNATEVDDRIIRELLKAIDQDPKLKLVASGAPGLKLKTDLSTPSAPVR
ncbi:MAG: mechanosensitive ion channel family protein [Acidobacteriia bacterium]|nr:mechanosensitive ion channel family protein [Terriglobia bacterium]